MPKTLNTLATLLQVVVAAALISESVGTASGCPMSTTSLELFSGDVDWMCSKNFACLTSYCSCVGGSIATVGGMTECVNATEAAATAENCAAARVSCTVGAALATTMSADGSMCYSSTQPLRDAYAQYYYDAAHRSTSNLTSACSADLCNVLSPIASSTAFNFSFICSLVGFPLVPPPSGGGGGGGGIGLPHNAACPNASKYYFATAPATCPSVHSCDTAYCSCLSLDYTSAGCNFPALNTSAVSEAAFQACANTYVRCLTTAAIDMWPGNSYNNSDPCQSWSSWVVNEYAHFYHSSSRSTTSFYTECTGLLCDSEYFFYNAPLDYGSVCSGLSTLPEPPTGGGGGGGGGLPHNAACPNATQHYFFETPSTCPPVASCNQGMCDCLGTPMSGGECNVAAINTSVVSEAAFQACANTYLRCVTTAAIDMWPGNSYNTSDPCQSWSNHVVNEYATFYHSSSRSTTSFYTECTGLLCDAEYLFYNATLDYGSVCSGLSTLPQPPTGGGSGGGGGHNGCVAPPQRYFDKMPVSQCPTIKTCLMSFCTCAGSTWNTTKNDCNDFTTPPSLAQAQACISTGLTCIVNQALLIYVPGAATDNLDPCVAWSVPIAADYAAWHASTSRQTTSLFATCNSTACSMLTDLGASAAQIAATCAYSGLTATPTYVPANPCAYSCPDSSCARTIAGCNCTKEAVLGTVGTAFTPALGSTFDPSRALSVQAYASYAVPNASAPCGTFDFSPFLIFNWRLANSSGTVVTFNASSFYIAAFALAPGSSYTLTLRTIGLIPSQTSTQSWTFTTTTPTPFVSITQRGSTVDMSTLAAYTIKTLIVDKYPVASPSFLWSCTPGDVSVACPSLTNATVNYLTIAAGANAGSYTITFTYRGVSSSIALTVIAGEIPIVSLLSTTVPIVAIPVIVYLPSQTINLFASVKYSGNVTYRWAVASTTVCTTKTCAINASSLTQSTASDLDIATNTPVMNTITLTVTDASVTTRAASASIQVAVAPTYTLAITVGNQNTPAATSATSLSDRLAFTATSSITTPGAPYGGVYQFTFGYGALGLPLLTQPTMSGFSAVAPLVITSAASSTVTFTGKLLVNGLLATRATATFSIAKPSNLTAVTAQLLGDTDSITDPGQAIAAAANLQEILTATTDPAQASAIGTAMLNMFTNSVKDFSSQSSDQVSATLTAIKAAAGTLSGASKTNAAAKLTSLVALALTAANFDPANGQGALSVLADVSAAQARATIALLALKMAIDATLAVGGTKIISSGGLSVSTYKQSMDALGGSTMVGDGFSVVMPLGLDLGLDADAIAATSGSASDEDIFDDGTGGTSPVGGVKTMTMVDESGNLIPVANLAEPICIDMGPSGSTCMYRDETLNEWVSTGLTSSVDSNGHLICCTSHFTSFGGFQSSAASVMLSLLAAAVVLAIQMMM